MVNATANVNALDNMASGLYQDDNCLEMLNMKPFTIYLPLRLSVLDFGWLVYFKHILDH